MNGQPALLVGHRGTGSCEEQDAHIKKCIDASVEPPPKIRENTLKAMKATHASGGNYVEFDVQLSKDGIPIIHHDYYTDDGRYVGDLTLQELQALNESENDADQHRYSTLESFFTQLPEDLGFDIEIKYPRVELNGTSQCPEFRWPIDEYVDVIVSSVKSLSVGSRRPMFYSCFTSAVCLVLHSRHPECPLVFLADGKNGHKLTEVRGHSAANALEFASSAGLDGVAVQSEELLTAPQKGRSFVEACHARGLRCFTWGPMNNDKGNRQLQESWAVDGIIFDNIHAACGV